MTARARGGTSEAQLGSAPASFRRASSSSAEAAAEGLAAAQRVLTQEADALVRLARELDERIGRALDILAGVTGITGQNPGARISPLLRKGLAVLRSGQAVGVAGFAGRAALWSGQSDGLPP